jgi:hypothetical protein
VPLSRHACDNAWRRLTAKRFSFNEGVSVNSVTRSSSSARTAIVDTAIAVHHAVNKPGASSGGGPIDGTNRARKGNSIIATASASTGGSANNAPA